MFMGKLGRVELWLKTHSILDTMRLLGKRIYADSYFDDVQEIEDCVSYGRFLRENTSNSAQYDTLFFSEIQDIYNNLISYKQFAVLLEDERSVATLESILLFRLTRDDRFLMEAFCPNERQYFADGLMRYKKNGVFVDCGALDGATTLEYISHVPDFRKVYAYEPMETAFEECKRNLLRYGEERIVIRDCAVSDKSGEVYFDDATAGSSHIAKQGTRRVKTVAIDQDILEPVDFIKMDIEGTEQQALMGARQHIKHDCPVLAICVYHKPEDLHIIPEMITQMNDKYRFFLRHHMMDANETVLYAIPKESKYLESSVNCKNDQPKELYQLILREYMYANTSLHSYIKYILNQLDAEKEAHCYFEAQYKTEREAHLYFEEQFRVSKESREFFEEQYKAEKAAHAYSESQLNTKSELKG